MKDVTVVRLRSAFLLGILFLTFSSILLGQSFSPVAWPSESAFRPIKINNIGVKDPRIQDPSDGGAEPQGYMNFASGMPDTVIPSVYIASNGSTIFVRMRLESSPTTYSGGAASQNTDPMYASVWHMTMDLNGDGWDDFGVLMDGSSGSPSTPYDVIRVIYSRNTKSHSVDPARDGVYVLGEVYATQPYTSGPYTGQLKQYDGSGNLITSNPWPLGRRTITYDFGTSRVIDKTATDENFTMDFQFPISLLNAAAYGGPTMTSSTLFMLTPVTGANPSEPYKKDASYPGPFNVNNELPAPGSDPMAFDSTIVVPEVVVTGVSITACPTPTLTATYLAPAKMLSGSTVANTLTTKDFYYWYDTDADGLADDAGSAWTLIAAGTAPQLGNYATTSWNTSTLPQGQYIIKFYAVGQFGDIADSYNQTVTGFVQVKSLFNNSCGTSPSPFLSATVTPSTVDASGSVAQRNVVYTITVTNEATVAVTLSSISDILPTGFTYVSNPGGTLTPSTSPTNGSTGTITWTFPATTIPAGSSATLSFNVTAGTTVGTFSSNFSATGSTSYTPALNAAPVTVTSSSASLALTASVLGTLTPSQAFTYTLSYQNIGSLPLNSAVIVDTLPEGLNFVSASNGGTYNPADRTVTWSVGTIAPEGSGTRTINVTVTSPYSGNTELTDFGTLYATEIPSGTESNVITHTVLNPVIDITHSPSPSTVTPGAQVTYTITYGNSGTSSATGTVIRDTLPSGQTYVAGSSSYPLTDSTGGILVWTIGTLASGSENNVITYQTNVTSPYPTLGSSQSVPNPAYISSNETATESATATITVNALPNVSIVTSSDQSVYYTTDTATITITLTNNGTTNATLSSIVDSLPSGFIYVSTGGGTLSPTTSPIGGSTGQITWSFSPSVTLAPGATATLVFRARTTTAGNFTNTGKATGVLVSTSSSTITHSIGISVLNAGSGINFTKETDKTTAVAGDTITYTIFYQNLSGGNQPGLVLRDTIPSGTTYVSSSATILNGESATFSFASGILVANMRNPFRDGDSSTIQFKVTVNTGTSGQISNKAGSYLGGTPTLQTNVVATNAINPPVLTFTKSVDISTAAPGATLTYTINYSNGSGAGTSTNTTILDTLPSDVTYVSGSASSGGSFNATIGPNGRVSWNIGSVAANTSGSVSFQVTVDVGTPNGTNIINTARLTNSEGVPASDNATTTVAALPELDITLSVNKSSASPGDTLVYTINYANDGTADANSTVIRDTLPSNVTFLSATGGGTLSSGVVTWNIGTLTFGSSSSVTFSVRINSPIASGSVSQILDSANISATSVQTVESNTVITNLHYPSLSLNISADSVFASPGSTYTYTIYVTNSSIVPAYNTVVFDTVPSNVTYVPNSTFFNGVLVSDISGTTALRTGLSAGDLPTGDVDTITYQVTVNSPLPNGLVIPNTAYATTSRITGSTQSNTWNVIVRSTPIVSLSKTSTLMGTGVPGDSILYTLTYGNSGNTSAYNIYLYDTIPNNSTYIEGSVTGTGATYDLVNNRIVIARDSLTAGTINQTATFKVLLAELMTSGANSIQNSALLTSSNAAATSDTTLNTINASSTMTIEKSGPEFSTRSGSPIRDTITYALTYSVTGNALNPGAVITDVLPTGLTYISSTLNGASAGSAAGQTVTWNIGTANPGSSGSATVTAYTASNGTYNNSSTLTSTPNPAGVNSNTQTTIVSNPVTGVLTVLSAIDPGDPDTISVNDADLKGQGNIFVTVTNPRTGENEIVGLTETGTNTGIFTGTVGTLETDSTATDNDGFFHVNQGDVLQATYNEELDATANPRTHTANTNINVTSPPAVVDVVIPAVGSTTSDNTPVLSGTTDPGNTVIVYMDGVPIDTVLADGSGNWSTVQPTPLSDGPHAVTAIADNGLGGTATDTNPFYVDTIPPTIFVDTPPDNSTTSDNTPLYTGRTEPLLTVIVRVDGTPIDTVQADANGNWSTTQPTPLSNGAHTVSGTVTDAAGNTATDTNPFNVNTSAPSVDVVTPANGSTTSDNTPSITGTTNPNLTVIVSMDGVPIDTVVANGAGNWSTVQPTPLSDGLHTVSALATDTLGQTATDANVFTVITSTPTIVIDNPADGAILNDNTPLYVGTTQPYLTVIVKIDGTPIDTLVADVNGNWSVNQPTPLSDGAHAVTAIAIDALGQTATDVNNFTINSSVPNVDVVTPANGSIISDNTPNLIGTTDPNLTVIISMDGTPIDTVIADSYGNWSTVQPTPLADGQHIVSAKAIDFLGQFAIDANTFYIDTTPPSIVITTPADGDTINDNTPLIYGVTEPYLQVIVLMDGTPIDTVTSDGAGNWTTVQPTPLSDGPHAVTANTQDDAGNTATDTNNFVVDTTPPTVNIDTPAEGSTTSDTTPPITGTTEPNLTVIVEMDGVPIDTVQADGLGNWSTNQPTPLADGPHQVTATAIDPAGNTATDVNNFNVDTTPPVIDVTTPANGSVVTDNTPTYFGTTDPNLTVIVKVDGVPIDTVVADGSGNWTAQQITPLADGPHTVRGTVTDSLGQTATDVNSFTIDTIAPSIIITSHPDSTVTTIQTPTICGTTESGSTVTLRIDGTLIGTTTANASGVWCVPVSTPLPEGPHDVVARATDPGGNPSADSVTYIVDLTPPSIVIVTPANLDTTGPITPIDGTTEPNITVIVYLDGTPIDTVQSDASGIWTTTSPSLATGWHTAQGKAFDDAGNNVTSLTHTFYVDATPPAIVIDTPSENSYTNDNTPTYTGRTEPNLTVIVKVDGVPIDTVVADGSGNWTTTQPTPLPDGPHTVSATATDPYGNSATDTNPFTVDTTPPTIVIDYPVDGSTITDNTPLYTGRTQRYLTVRASVDGVPIDTLTSDASGNWSTPQITSLPDGAHSINAVAIDSAGNTATDTNNFIIDTTPPPVTVDSPAPSDTTNDNTPDICGTSEAGARIIVKIDNTIVDTVFADAGGNWCVTAPVITDGPHTITVTAKDSAGNTTTYGPTGTSFRVNTKPTISSIGPSSRLLCDGDLNLTVSGTNFFSNSVIRLNGVSQTTTFVDSSTLTTTIPAASLATAGTYSITVYTPPTGGGTSSAKTLTVDGATTSITGYVYWDRNISGTKDASEVGISGWVISLTAPSPANNQTTSTITGGSYTFANLGTGSYTVTVSPATGWSSTIPASGSASYSVTCGSQTTGANFGFTLSDSTSDTTKYRTFTPASMLVKKPVKKVCHLLDWNFTFTNNTGRQAEALYVEFNNIVNVFYSYAPFTVIDDLGANTQDYMFLGALVDTGESVQITGWSKIQPCDIRINKWWWIYDDSSISKHYSEGPLRPDSITKYLPMPNAANIRDEIFRQVFQPSGGMLVGAKVSPNPQKFAWVLMRRSNDLFVSLEDKTGKHTRRPRGFTRDVGESQVMRGKLPQLPPRKHNNRLFAEMTALRLNIAASISDITPNGLGVLIYDDGSTNPFNGLTISRIAGLIDTSLTYYRGRTEAYYLAADSTIRKINEAFYGDIDTISWSTELRLTGVKSVSEIPFLRPNPGAVAMTMEQSPDWLNNDEVPDEFTVQQNYPNPFNPTTTIDFYLPFASTVSVSIYDILGKEVGTLFNNELMESGEQTIQFNASELSSGVYFYKVSATVLADEDESMGGQTFVSMKKMVLLK